MAAPKIYLVTGANRGIGKGFISFLLQRPSTTVIAGVRDPSHSTAKSLTSLPKAEGSKLIIVRVDSSDNSSAQAAIQALKSDHGITSLDVVIANAGIGNNGGTVRETSADNISEHIQVNTIAPVMLFQATADLLQVSTTKQPLFVATSTLIGSIGFMENLVAFPKTQSPYGGSKAAMNWFIRRLHFEEPWLTSFVFHPGLVETDLATAAVAVSGKTPKDFGAISVETSVNGMMDVIDKATKDISGKFKLYDGNDLPW